MAKKRCNACVGSGRVMGGGMMTQDCEVCDGIGKIFIPDDPIDHLMRKESEGYINAKNKIKNLDDKLTDKDAEKLLDDELAKTSSDVLNFEYKPKKKNKRDDNKAG